MAIIQHTRAVPDLLADQSLRKLVSGLHRLSSLPTVYRELSDELRKEEASIDRVARIMSKDMSMVMKILQIINSPFYGLLGNISSVPHAVALLGLDTIKALVLFTKVFSQFEGTKESGFSLDMLWRHSTVTGGTRRCWQRPRTRGRRSRMMPSPEDSCTISGCWSW